MSDKTAEKDADGDDDSKEKPLSGRPLSPDRGDEPSAESEDSDESAEESSDEEDEEDEKEESAEDAPGLAARADARRLQRRAPAPRVDDEAPLVTGIAGHSVETKFKPNYVFLVVASGIFLAADLGTKWLAVKKLSDKPQEKVVVINGFFNLDRAENRGGAWGLLGDQPDHIRLPFFFLISAIAVVFIVSLYRKLEPQQKALKWALPLVLGGALGNLADRVRHQYVIDFIDWYVKIGGKENHWPTFNVADVWIVVGVGLMIIDMFTPRAKLAKASADKPRRNVVVVTEDSPSNLDAVDSEKPAPKSERA